MDRSRTRQLASLLLIAAIILLVIKEFLPKNEVRPAVKEGYVEIKKSEYNRLKQKAQEQKNNETEKAPAKPISKKNKTSEKVIHLNIHNGMSSKDVSLQLQKAGLIKNADEFNDYLANKKIQHLIQIGDYDLTSQMSLEEIADVITGGRS